MYSNMKYYENICNCLRVIQQEKNRKLKSYNCWQQTSLTCLSFKTSKIQEKLVQKIYSISVVTFRLKKVKVRINVRLEAAHKIIMEISSLIME